MPAGAGSATVAWAAETSYLGGVGGTPTYYLPGTNVRVQTSELSRNLTALYAPGDTEATDFLAQQLSGQLGVQFTLKNDEFHRLIFNDSNTDFTSGLANSAEWYLGVDEVNGTAERQIKGWAPATCEIAYNGTTESVTVTLTGAYGDEDYNTAITPGSINDPGGEVAGHGAEFKVDSTKIDYLQSGTISFSNIARLLRGTEQKPVEAVAGNVTSEVTMNAVYDGATETYEQILGSSGVNSIQTTVDTVTGNISFNSNNTTRASYSFSMKPENYDWADLVNNDAELNETITFRGRNTTGSSP